MASYPQGVVVDIGTGDGLFPYRCARRDPNRFFIGIDANPRGLEKQSEKVHRKPAKGGAPNILFIQAPVEDLPAELSGVANEVYVHFPWGSLLRALASGDGEVLRGIRRICSPGCRLEILIGLDPERDGSEIARLRLDPLSAEYLANELRARYIAAGFRKPDIVEIPKPAWLSINTSWAKRLRTGAGRRLIRIRARAG